ncbi:MAG: S24 family peptidase [bacterium]|nr:S24 family peptidase [bacterium]
MNQSLFPFPQPPAPYLDLNDFLVDRPASSFFVGVVGDSMSGAGIFHGDLLVVDAAEPMQSGKVVVVRFQGEVLVKRWVDDGEDLFLRSECEGGSNLLVAERSELDLLGVVRWVLHQP